MKLAGILIALAIVALLVARQPGMGPSGGSGAERERDRGQPPSVPEEAGEVSDFEDEMGDFMEEAEEEQRERLEQAR